eukprot:TRINITY_DN1336_c0_g1_i9.p1 TRINITY_DN1336_c0_g1~~TRINITY_DN1336_c0_g1_i9.p1  ORF type:complete len:470 (-),score=91.55 TRINITY_DN1336_c0_g1_i9:123-1397(-)
MTSTLSMTDKELPAKIASAVALADSDSPQAAIDTLLTLERTSRLAEAAPETAAICTELVRLAYTRQGWVALGEMVVLLSKRRSQLKAAVSRSVQEAMRMLKEEKPDEDTQVQLLKTLCDVTSGKIYVEVERASLTRSLATIYESRGDISTAADLMQELQVETFSAMDRRDKYDFILEQVRLCLDKTDIVRAGIMAKKILPRQISREGLEDIKLRYYALMVRIHVANEDMLEICRAYIARYETTTMTGDAAEPWARELRLAAAFVVLSPYGPMQKDLLHRLSGDKALANLPEYQGAAQALHHLRADPATGPHGPLWGGARQPHCGRPQRRRGGGGAGLARTPQTARDGAQPPRLRALLHTDPAGAAGDAARHDRARRRVKRCRQWCRPKSRCRPRWTAPKEVLLSARHRRQRRRSTPGRETSPSC